MVLGFFDKARRYVFASMRTSLVAAVFAVAYLLDFFFDIPGGVLEALQVLAIVLIGIFAKDEKDDRQLGDRHR